MHVLKQTFNPILRSERPKLYTILALLSAIGLNADDSLDTNSDAGKVTTAVFHRTTKGPISSY